MDRTSLVIAEPRRQNGGQAKSQSSNSRIIENMDASMQQNVESINSSYDPDLFLRSFGIPDDL